MGAKGWVTLRATSRTPFKLLTDLIDESYRAPSLGNGSWPALDSSS
jgi:hypothetical protein